MGTREGITGTGAKHYAVDDALLDGVRASEYEPKVYPENRCPQCEKNGVFESEHCWKHHWSKGKKK